MKAKECQICDSGFTMFYVISLSSSQFQFLYPFKMKILIFCDSYLEPQGVFFVVLSHSCFRMRVPSNSSADILCLLQKESGLGN